MNARGRLIGDRNPLECRWCRREAKLCCALAAAFLTPPPGEETVAHLGAAAHGVVAP